MNACMHQTLALNLCCCLQHADKSDTSGVTVGLTKDDTADDARCPGLLNWGRRVDCTQGQRAITLATGACVGMRVARDLQAHYGLSDAAHLYVLQVCIHYYSRHRIADSDNLSRF
jgi:hypothetical protein